MDSANFTRLVIFQAGYRAFMTPLQLLALVEKSCYGPNIDSIFQFMCLWIERHFGHDRMVRPLLYGRLESFAIKLGPKYNLRQRIQLRFIKEKLKTRIAIFKYLQIPDTYSQQQSIPKIEDLTSKYSAHKLADRLTALEAALVAKIHPTDFHKLPEMSEALSRQTKLFNHSTFAIVSMILAAGEAKDRSRTIEYFVEVAKRLDEARNFDSESAVLAALNSASISRLKKTWNLVSVKSMKDFEELQEGLDRKRYNERINELQTTNQPFIPIIAKIRGEITLLNDGMKDQLEDGKCNSEKLMTLGKLINQIMTPSVSNRVHEKFIKDWCSAVALDEDAAWDLSSMKVEPSGQDTTSEFSEDSGDKLSVDTPSADISTLDKSPVDVPLIDISSIDNSSIDQSLIDRQSMDIEPCLFLPCQVSKWLSNLLDASLCKFIDDQVIGGSEFLDLTHEDLKSLGFSTQDADSMMQAQMLFIKFNQEWRFRKLLDDVFGNEPDLKDCLAILKQNNETLETISSKSTKEFIEMGITLLGHQKKLIRLSRDALQRSKSDHSDVKTEDSHSVQ